MSEQALAQAYRTAFNVAAALPLPCVLAWRFLIGHLVATGASLDEAKAALKE